MHYYQHNIGDYRRDTAHLSLLEHGIYRQLLDTYYLDESPIPRKTEVVYRRLQARTEEERKAVDEVLNEYFQCTENGWIHARCDAEIASYALKAERARENGKLGGRKPKTKAVISGNPEGTQIKANHKPLTINQEPRTINQSYIEPVGSSPHSSLPDCPHIEILKLWEKHFPQLTQPRVWDGARKIALKARWIQAAKKSDYSKDGYDSVQMGLAWWDSFFAYIASDTKLPAGFDSAGRSWRPDLPWVCKAENFAKIVEGKYDL